MLFKSILTASLAILSFALSAEANDDYYKVHDVIVGGAAGLVYTPNQVWAHPGDKVKFHFQFKNHTVTQSSFDEPCKPLKGGFDSGFMPVGMDVKDGPTFTIEVKDYEPIWAHCEQIDHCPSGMVFAVNAPEKGNTFEKFLKMAKESEYDDNYDGNDDGHYDDGHYDEHDDGEYHDGGSYKRSILSRVTGKLNVARD
ncbi:hypothetical protein FS837_001278 [Tulasnella sp. UAMH 9824]|nr:hypothetical protein FS837_001278 [Tulasnella sp. UAMH 9824]